MNDISANPLARVPLSFFEINVIWLLLAGSTVVFFQVHLGPAKFGINLSPFDAIVPAVAGLCFLCGRIAWPQRAVWAIAIGLLILFGMHSVVSFSLFDVVSPARLAQGAVKLSAFIILIALATALFRAEELRKPPYLVTAAVFTATTLYMVLLKILLIRGSIGSFIPLTNLMSGLVGTLFLFNVSAYQDGRRGSRQLAWLASVVTLIITILFFNKGFALVACCFLVVTMFAWRGTHLERFTYGWRLVGALFFVLAAASVIVSAMLHFELMPISTDTIERSLSIRSVLWNHAISIGDTAFPLGIGAGQFATTTGSMPTMVIEGHHVAHSTALTWFAEYGLLGLLLAFGLLALVWRAALSWPGSLRLMFVLYLAVPLILHDGHGIRMAMLILALGIANAIYGDEPTPN